MIPLADAMIRDRMTDMMAIMGESFTDLRHQQQPGMQALIQNDRLDFIQDFNQNIINVNPSRVDYSSIRFYYDSLVEFEKLEALRQECILAARQLTQAHAILAENIKEKRKLKDLIVQTRDLVSAVQHMKDLVLSFHS